MDTPNRIIHNPVIFRNRESAGLLLAKRLLKYKKEDLIILALPRGGVVVAEEVAKKLERPLEVIVARKIGSPYNSELGIGAISENNVQILDTHTIQLIGVSSLHIHEIIEREQKELKRRIKLYRKGKSLPSLQNKTVILIDDGVATGATARAAIETIYKLQPLRLIFAVPVCSPDVAEVLQKEVDEFICLYIPNSLEAIGQFYQNFDQVTDDEVMNILLK